jgi:hypothetical protein
MNSNLQARGNAIYPDTTTDLTQAIGKLVTFTAGVPSVNGSTTVPAVGIVLDAANFATGGGNSVTHNNAIGILGALPGPVRALVSAASVALSLGDTVQQAADGTLTKDLGLGNARVVVGVCTDENGGNPGDLCEFTLFTPAIRI